MAERERGLETQVLFHDVQIRVAHAGTADLDDDLARAWRRPRDILNLSFSAHAHESDGLHDPSSVRLLPSDGTWRAACCTAPVAMF
jgi:hypothetical protein